MTACAITWKTIYAIRNKSGAANGRRELDASFQVADVDDGPEVRSDALEIQPKLGLQGMGRLLPQRHYEIEDVMKTIFAVAVLAVVSVVSVAPAFAQPPSDTTSNNTVRPYNTDHHYGRLGLLGLVGLAGLAGLRPRKSVDHERIEATGVNVKSVKV